MSKYLYKSRRGWSGARALVALPLFVIAAIYLGALWRVAGDIAAQRGRAFLVGAALTYTAAGAVGAAMCAIGILLDKAKLKTIGAVLLAAAIFAWVVVSNTKQFWLHLVP